MQAVDEKMKTIHVYVVRGKEKRPNTALPLFCAFLCLLGIVAVTFYSAQHPYYEHERLTVPAKFLPLKVFSASVPIIPTGVKTYPAVMAHGLLTITNGSVIGQAIPAGFTVQGVATDYAVYVPGGNANGYGVATVQAHMVLAGLNLSMLAVNTVIGSSLFIRNLRPFTGGHPAYSVKYATALDKQAALIQARSILAIKAVGLHYPCVENQFFLTSVKITWRCQFVTYHIPSYMHVSSVRLDGKNLVLDVVFTPLPRPGWVK